MKSFVALVRREYLEHRGAFLYAPLILVALFTVFIVMAFVSGHYRFNNPGGPLFYRIFDLGYLVIAALWMGYLFVAVFFYFADAFNADRRANAMFFWKSVPQSDLKILVSKLVAGLTILPALVFLALLLTGIVAAAATLVAPFAIPILAAPDFGGTVVAWAEISLVAFGYMVLALLWYAPFFAWVGGLSTVVGRWSIPLALLIPVVLSLLEGVIDFGSAPGGSYILSYLRDRMTLKINYPDLQVLLFANTPLDVPRLADDLFGRVDWLSLLAGLLVAVVLVYAASQYRRRVVKG
jgi:ABC-2 type transport system permease protein